MVTPMLEFPANAQWIEAGPPAFGGQDIGVTPGGAMDQFSHQTGQILLGNAPDHASAEFMFPMRCRVQKAGWIVLMGARRQGMMIPSGGEPVPIQHGHVVEVSPGCELDFSHREIGFRSYLCWREKSGDDGNVLAGRSRGNYNEVFSWPDPEGCIRIMPGPEADWVENPEALFTPGWRLSKNISAMGMRLEHAAFTLKVKTGDMISDVVADGTIQLSPSGPIILMRHRQTVGGYPRIFNVISTDVDVLAQMPPEQTLQFKQVSLDQARIFTELKASELNAFKKRFN